ncbi:hypothetical protein BDW62DRAFT_197114 [Aspergillus aurantiobrunneus]
MADIPGLDEFAQTRGADDLFDDEIIPVPAEEQQPVAEPEPQVVGGNGEPVAPSTVDREATPIYNETSTRSRGERRGRGRGRGGRGGRGARDSDPKRPEGSRNNKPDDGAPQSEVRDEGGKVAETPEKAEEPGQEDVSADTPRVPAVRGDRSATGGVKKPKLTEEELSRRIAAVRENAAKVAAAHARAEADQASFMEREKVAEKKRREERANRRVMDTERERNRLRKLEALNGREWDAEKPEEQFSSRGGRGQFRRGMHGGVSGYTRRGLEESQAGEESPDGYASQQHGNRGRGRGGRGGRGRGGHRGAQDRSLGEKPYEASTEEKAAPPTPVVNNETEFPSLPGGEKKEANTNELKPTPDQPSKPLSPISGGTWADQVEAQRE